MSKAVTGLRFTAPEDDNAALEAENAAGLDASDSGSDASIDAAQKTVNVRVLPQGDGRIFTGATDADAVEAQDRFPTHGRGAILALAPAVAAELERRGLVEIQT